MGLLDNKGRIFGKINIIDAAAVLLIIVIMVAAGLYFNKVNTQTSLKKTGDNMKISYDIELKNMLPEVIDSIKAGDKLTDDVKSIALGTVKEIKDRKMSEDLRENAIDGAYVTTSSPNKYQAVITVESDAKIANDSLKIGEIDIKIGKGISVKGRNDKGLGNYAATGYIIGVRSLY